MPYQAIGSRFPRQPTMYGQTILLAHKHPVTRFAHADGIPVRLQAQGSLQPPRKKTTGSSPCQSSAQLQEIIESSTRRRNTQYIGVNKERRGPEGPRQRGDSFYWLDNSQAYMSMLASER